MTVERGGPTGLQRALRPMAIGLLCMLIGAGGTWALALGELGRARAGLAAAEAKVEVARSREALVRARLSVDEAVEHLDQQNFGLVVQDLSRASLALGRIAPEAAPWDPERLNVARGAVDRLRVEPGGDLPGMRRELLRVEGLLARLETADVPVGTE